jgi:hypothetical protein
VPDEIALQTAGPVSIADRLGILDTYARQAHRIDGGDAAGWAATFTPDGSFESPTYKLTAVGREALTEFAAASNSNALARGVQLRHWMSNLLYESVAPGRIRVEAYMVIFATSSEGSRVDRCVRSFDELVEVDGSWLVQTRRIQRDG